MAVNPENPPGSRDTDPVPVAQPAWPRRHWKLITAIVVPIVTLVTIVIPLIADANSRVTSVDTLVAGANTPGPDNQAQAAVATALNSIELPNQTIEEFSPDSFWRVPVSAPLDTFPVAVAANDACAPEQVAWLEQWGRRDAEDIWNGYLTLTNTASDGSAMSVRNIRSVGTFTEPAVPEVDVTCGGGFGAVSEIIALEQDLGTDSAAVYLDTYGDQPAGAPATLNLSPGEALQVTVFFTPVPDRTASFAGSLVADVVVGDSTTETTLFEGFTRKGAAGITATKLTVMGPTIYCDLDGLIECTLAEFVQLVHNDPGLTP